MAIVGTASIRVRAITTGFEAELKRAAHKIEKTMLKMERGAPGDLFKGNKQSFAQLNQQATGTYDAINGLITKSYFLQSAISAIVPVIASAGAGLFALGSQAAAAAPALIVLPSLLTAIAQAGIVAKMGLGGLFKAVGELGKAKTTKGVDQMPAKLAAMASAQQRVDRAQRSLNDAYRTAAERLQQLGFDTEDAAVGQERAAIALEEARETLARVQDLPPNSKARREAELAFREADINYRRSIDRNKDLQEEQDRASKGGTLNGEEQVKQSREVLDAQLELKNATNSLAKAQLDLKKSQSGGAGASLDEFKKLSKAGQELAKYLVSIKPKIQELKDAAGEKLFKPLQDSISNLVDNFFPKLIPIFRDTGEALGLAALDFSKAITNKDNLKDFERVGRTNVDTIGKLGKVIGNLYGAFITLLAAADPLIRRFTDWVVQLTAGWNESIKLKDKTGALADTFKVAGDIAAQLGDIIGNLIGGLMDMGRAASGPGSGGQMIFDSLERNTKKFKDWANTVLKDGSLEDYFKKASTTFLKTAGIIGKIFGIILKSATQPGTNEFLDSISRAVDYLGDGFEHLVGSAPAFGRFIEGFARMTAGFAESGSIKAFFDVLTNAVNFVADLFENELVAKIFASLAVLHGAKLAFIVLKNVVKLVAFYILGWLIKSIIVLISVGKKVKFIFMAFKGALGLTATGALLVVAAIAAVVAILVMAYKKSEKFRKALSDLVKTTFTALIDAGKDIKKAFDDAFGTILNKGTSVGSIFKTIGDFLAKYIVPIYKYIIPRVIDIFKQLVIAAIKMVGGIVQVIYGLFEIIGGFIKLFKGDFKGAFKSLIDGVADIFWGLLKVIGGVFKAIPALIKMALGNSLGPIGFLIYEGIAGAFKLVGKAIAFIWSKIIKPVFEAIGTVISFVWSNVLKPVFGLIADAFGAIAGPAADGIGKVFGLIGSALGKIGGAGLKGFSVAFSAIADAAGILGQVLKPVLDVLLKIAKVIGIVLYVAALVAFTAIGLLVAALWRTLKRVGVAIWQNLIYPFAKYLKPSIEKVFIVVNGLLYPFKIVFKAIWLIVKIFIGLFIYAFRGLKALFKFIFSDTMRKIVIVVFLIIMSKLDKLKDRFFSVLGAIGDVFGKIFGVIGKVVSVAFEIMKKVYSNYWETLKMGLNNLLVLAGKIFDGVSWAFSKAWRAISAVFDFVWPKIKEGFSTLWDVAKWVFDKVLTGFKLAWNGIKAAFENVWPAIWGAIQWAWENVIKPTFDKIGEVFGAIWGKIKEVFSAIWPTIWGAISWAWENVYKPVFNKIGEVFGYVWGKIKEVFNAIWPTIWGAISWAWENVIKPTFEKIGEVFGAIWGKIKEVFSPIWGAITQAISWAWENVIKPTFEKIGEVFGAIWGKIKEVFDAIWPTISGAISWVWETVIKPVFNKIGEVFGTVWTGIKNAFNSVWDGIKLAFTNFPEFIKGVWNKAIGFINGFLKKIVEGFKQIPSLIGAVFKGIIDGFKSAINWIIDKYNTTIGNKSFTTPWGATFGFGKISPIGGDSKTNWEDVVTGGYREIPGLALGGTVLPRAGGTLVNVAEAGRAERIEPLDQDGLSQRDKAMIAVLSGGNTGGAITLNVYPSPGMNEVELAALVNRQLAFQLRRGAA